MTDYQYQLFCESRFPLLYIPVDKSKAVSDARPSLLDRTSNIAVSGDKIWWLECTRLSRHLAQTTRFLTRHAPTHFVLADGHAVAIKYELPRLVQSVLIDELTSFYVFNLLRRYIDDKYNETVMFESDDRTSEVSAEHVRVWYDYTKDFDETNHISLECLSCDSFRFESADNRLKFLQGESLFLGRGCGTYPYSQYLWFGPSLKQTADALASSSHRPEYVTVSMESAVPFIENRLVPYIITPDVQSWMMNAGMSLGRVKPRELFRLCKFLHGNCFVEHWNWDSVKGKLLEDEQKDEAKVYHGEMTDEVIECSVERQSVWWSREQQMWKYMVASKPDNMADSTNQMEDDRPMDTQVSNHMYSEMFQQYLYFAAETTVWEQIHL